jgi:hypothetical protein
MTQDSAPAVWTPKPQYAATLRPLAVIKEHRDPISGQVFVVSCRDTVTGEHIGYIPSVMERFYNAPSEAAFQAALQLVERIDARLAHGRPYRDLAGRVLADLGDVVDAILTDNLQLQES